MNDRINFTDQRQLPIQINRELIDEWMPIIGPVAYAIYSMYIAHSQVSIREVARHVLGSSKNTNGVRVANAILESCGLIVVYSGTPNTPNSYAIVNPIRITPEVLQRVKQAVNNNPVLTPDYMEYELTRLNNAIDKWQAFFTPYDYMPGPYKNGHVPHVPPAPAPAPPAPTGTSGDASAQKAEEMPAVIATIEDEQRSPDIEMIETKEIMQEFGLSYRQVNSALNDYDYVLIRQWVYLLKYYPDYIPSKEPIQNKAGYLLTCLRNGKRPNVSMCHACHTRPIVLGGTLYCDIHHREH